MKKGIIVSAVLIIIMGFLNFFAFKPSAPSRSPFFEFKWADFNKNNIEIGNFVVCAINNEGTCFIGLDKVYDPKLIKKGLCSRLLIFNISGSKLKNLKEVKLPFPDIPQVFVDNLFEKAVVTGKRGTQYGLVDLVTGELKMIFQHEKGKPGFKCNGLLHFFNGNFYAFGYMYDKDQIKTFEGLAKMNLAKSGTAEMFEPILDFAKVKELTKLSWSGFIFGDPETLYISTVGLKEDMPYYLFSTNAKELAFIDESFEFGVFAAVGKRVFYSAKTGPGTYKAVVKDLKENKTWTVYDGNKPMNYQYISQADGGKTILTCDFSFQKEVETVYYGHEKVDFKLTAIPELTDVPFGTLRISNNGLFYFFMNIDGLKIGRIPKE